MTKVITGKVRFSYVNVWTPKAIEGSTNDPKYSVSIIISKDDTKTLTAVKNAIETAKAEFATKFGGKVPANLKSPLRDGDIERPEDAAYENCYFINANSTHKPGVVDADVNPILDQDEFYSGCYGRASIDIHPYNSNGNKGVRAELNNLQKLADGERLSGKASAADDFGSGLLD